MTRKSSIPVTKTEIVDDTIFCSVVSLDESDTPATVRDLVDKSSRPVRVCVVLQSDDDSLRGELAAIPEVDLVAIAFRNARGPVFARAVAQTRYLGQPWFYQCDAHTRHADGWDDLFIGWLTSLQGKKNLISTYAPPVFCDEGTSYILPLYWDETGLHVTRADGYTPAGPVRARFLGGGQIFAPGQFVTDIPYNPLLYFHGEEQSMAVRSWAKGWSIWHPPSVATWYSAPTAPCPRHWEAFPDLWGDLQHISANQSRLLFRWDEGFLGPYGVSAEDLSGWAEWSGCDPAARTIESDPDWRLRHGYPG